MNVSLDRIVDVPGDELVLEGEIVVSDMEDCLPLRQRILGRGGWGSGRRFRVARQMDGNVVVSAVVLRGCHAERQGHHARLCRTSHQIRNTRPQPLPLLLSRTKPYCAYCTSRSVDLRVVKALTNVVESLIQRSSRRSARRVKNLTKWAGRNRKHDSFVSVSSARKHLRANAVPRLRPRQPSPRRRNARQGYDYDSHAPKFAV